MDYRTQRAFTLIELLMVLAVAVIIASLAAPPMAQLYHRHQLDTYQADLMRLIAQARHHALVNRTRVTVCALDRQGRCAGAHSGLLTSFDDRNGNRVLDAGEVQMQQLSMAGALRLDWNRGVLQFNGRGLSPIYNATFIICHQALPDVHRKVVLSSQGRVRGEYVEQPCPLSQET